MAVSASVAPDLCPLPPGDVPRGPSAARLLSVVIPCRDHGRYVSEAVTSVLGQPADGVKVEVILVDDHSSDAQTLDVLSALERAHGAVRLLCNRGAPGPAAARNVGIAAARGEWVAFLDADDAWVPGGLAARWRVVETCPEAQWLGADFVRRFADGTEEAAYYATRPGPRRVLGPAFESGHVLRLERPIVAFLQSPLPFISTVMVRREVLERVGGFDIRLRQAEDVDLWLRLARIVDFYFVPVVAARYRRHPGSLTYGLGDATRKWSIRALRGLASDPEFAPYLIEIDTAISWCYRDNISIHRARGEPFRAAIAAVRLLSRRDGFRIAWQSLVRPRLARRARNQETAGTFTPGR